MGKLTISEVFPDKRVSYQSGLFTHHRLVQQRQQLQPRQFPVYVSTASSSILINRQNRSTMSKQQFPMPQQSGSEPRYSWHQQETDSPVNSDVFINRTTEQFGAVDESKRQGRTFSFISDFIKRLTPCVYPCTIEAFRDDRCCIVVPQPPLHFPPQEPCCYPPPHPFPPQPPPPPPPCCYPPLHPFPPPLPPPPPPPPHPMPIPRPPINCCMACTSFGFYGPPPCNRFGFGGAAPLLGGLSNNAVGWGRTAAALQSNLGSTETQVTIYVPRPSSLTSLYVGTRDM